MLGGKEFIEEYFNINVVFLFSNTTNSQKIVSTHIWNVNIQHYTDKLFLLDYSIWTWYDSILCISCLHKQFAKTITKNTFGN